MPGGRICRRAGATLAGALCLVVSFCGLAVAADDDPDACQKARAEDVAALITSQDKIDIRAGSGHPAPGESTCLWSAVQSGLTSDAPPDGTLSIAFYHFANAARATDQMRRLAAGGQAPSLVRTADGDDQVLRTDATMVVTRHGSDIVVADAQGARSSARERAGWVYRLEALAFAAAGAKVLGPTDDRATASLCKLVAPEHVLALLTLTPSTLDLPDSPEDDGLRCYFSVKDASRDPTGWTHNDGTAQVRREDLGTNAAALERLHADGPFFKPSTLVATDDANDRVVPTPDHPEDVEAVHGPYVVTLHLTGVTPEARANATWAYRVQRTALEIAGATIKADAAMPPDPVTPGPPPPPAAFAWQTSDHQPPTWSWLLEPVAHVLVFMSRHRFVLMPVLILGGILLAATGTRDKPARPSAPAVIGYQPDPPPRRSSRRWMFAPLMIGAAVLNLIFGTSISGLAVHELGAEGRATITGSHGTGTVYNDQRVMGYDVLIRTSNGKTVETGFEDDDFNVYPHHNATTYPGEGDEFNVRYLRKFPSDFVILGEDGSPWAHGLRCRRLARITSEADSKAQFAPDVAAYSDALAAARAAEAQAGCGQGP